MTKKSVYSLAKENKSDDDLRLPNTRKLKALLALLDRIPEREDAYNPLAWDKNGLPE